MPPTAVGTFMLAARSDRILARPAGSMSAPGMALLERKAAYLCSVVLRDAT